MTIVYPCERCGHMMAWDTKPANKEKFIDTHGEEAWTQLTSWEGWNALGGNSFCTVCNVERFGTARLTLDGILSVGECEILT